MTLAALAAMLWSLPAAAQEEYRQPALENPESWSVVVIPDLQGYAKNEASQPIARLMTAWIADNIERLNVRMVLCVGDVVEQNDRIGNGFSGDLTSVRQWQGMADAFDVLDGRVPYLVATGNHDYTYTRSTRRRSASSDSIRTRIPPSRTAYKGQNENSKSVEIGKAVKMQ